MIFLSLAALVVVAFAVGRRTGRDLERLLHAAVAALSEGESTGLALSDRLEREGVTVSAFGIYPVLRRLERAGVVSSREVPGGPERGGRPRRIYRLNGSR